MSNPPGDEQLLHGVKSLDLMNLFEQCIYVIFYARGSNSLLSVCIKLFTIFFLLIQGFLFYSYLCRSKQSNLLNIGQLLCPRVRGVIFVIKMYG